MKIDSHRYLWGPNAWASVAVLDATVRMASTGDGLGHLNRAVAAIDAALPERAAVFGPFQVGAAESPEELRLLAEVALALQGVARSPQMHLYRMTSADEEGVYRLAIESPDAVVGAECLTRACSIVAAAVASMPLDLDECRVELVDLADDVCVGPSTMLMVLAAEARGIPWQRIGDQSLVQLGQGASQRRIWTAETDRTSAIAESISRNKQLTKRLIAAAGVPVPRGRVVETAAEAWEAARWIGGPFVLKPLDGNHGRGVFLNLTTREEVERAFPVAADEGRSSDLVVVEEYVPGVEHRLLVVGGRVRACAQGEYVYVTGDGHRTVAGLIDTQVNSNDPRRGGSESMPNKTVKLDTVVLTELAQQGLGPDSVPTAGRRVLVKRSGTHGPDVLPRVHAEIAAAAVRAARAVGLDVAGIDLVAQDISRPLQEQGAKVCEVNAGPQLLIHSNPSQGAGVPVGEAIVDELFAAGADGRIPVVVLSGGRAAAAASYAERILRAAGRVPGMTSAGGRWVAGWQSTTEPMSTSSAARDMLTSPEIDAAVFQLDWQSIAAEGMPVDRCDVIVLLEEDLIGGPKRPHHAGVAHVDFREGALVAMLRALKPDGVLVIQAGLQGEISASDTRGCRTITIDASDQPLTETAPWVGVLAGRVVWRDGDTCVPLVDLAAAPGAEPLAVLAAAAVGYGLGLPATAIRAGLVGC